MSRRGSKSRARAMVAAAPIGGRRRASKGAPLTGSEAVSPRCATTRQRWPLVAAVLGLLGCLLWSYWPTLVELAEFWARNQDYSSGALVPPAVLYLVWRQRAALLARPAQPCWWGMGLLALAEVLRQLGIYYGVGSGERYALVVSIAGVVLLAAGWRVFRRLTWVLVFLLLMVPLPARVHEAVALPLQQKAVASGAFLLELLGFFVMREGHVLRLEDRTSVAVAEACSGLRMLTAFVFVAAVLAFLIDRPRWQKAVLVLFSIPIAVASNSIRVVATSMFIYYADDPGLGEQFHDLAGLAMMPLAVGLSVGLLRFLALLQPVRVAGPPTGGLSATRTPARSVTVARCGHEARAVAFGSLPAAPRLGTAGGSGGGAASGPGGPARR